MGMGKADGTNKAHFPLETDSGRRQTRSSFTAHFLGVSSRSPQIIPQSRAFGFSGMNPDCSCPTTRSYPWKKPIGISGYQSTFKFITTFSTAASSRGNIPAPGITILGKPERVRPEAKAEIQGNLHLPVGRLRDLGARRPQWCFLGSIPLDLCSGE